MNILLLSTHFDLGGISQYQLNLCRGLIERGHKVVLSSAGGNCLKKLNRRAVFFPVDIRTKSELSPKLILALPKLINLIRRSKIEIIHAQTRITQVLAFYLSLLLKVPFVSTCHGFFRPHLGRRIFPCWGKKVIAISRGVKRHLIENFRVDADRIVLIPNGVEVKETVPDKEMLSRYNLKQGKVVGFVGRLSSVKGLQYLIRAMERVLREEQEVRLVIIGEGRMESELRRLSEDLNISERVLFLGAILDVERVLPLIDIFVFPSLQEGLGLALLEAMAIGKPVIASDVGGISEIISSEKNGLLVPPKDIEGLSKAIQRLLRNPDVAAQMGKQAQETVKRRFFLERMVKDTEEVYKQVLSKEG